MIRNDLMPLLYILVCVYDSMKHNNTKHGNRSFSLSRSENDSDPIKN